jgi:hypothetical protein
MKIQRITLEKYYCTNFRRFLFNSIFSSVRMLRIISAHILLPEDALNNTTLFLVCVRACAREYIYQTPLSHIGALKKNVFILPLIPSAYSYVIQNTVNDLYILIYSLQSF